MADGFVRWMVLAMGASLAVTLANILMKSFEHQIKSTKEIINKISKNDREACPEYNRRVTYRERGGECENLWEIDPWKIFLEKVFDDQLYAKTKHMVWYSSNCQKIYKLEGEPET